ncbi:MULTISPECIES: type III-A CRISPR-associated protein Csm2 [unclassified Anabaena]|uniref:type III-A CRISPR-associated protein Csm2 n=1 Tax=unclassified Anabaena TaxID=2619674 RepID=UPI0039C689E3
MTQAPIPRNREDISLTMVNKIDKFTLGFQEYEIRELVKHTEELGKELVKRQLKTNQVRKFLDAVKRLKSKLDKTEIRDFNVIKDDLVFLRPQLAYAAARQQKDNKDLGPVAPFKQVLEAAIKQVNTTKDFDKFVQLVESIIAYHKAAGGKDQ